MRVFTFILTSLLCVFQLPAHAETEQDSSMWDTFLEDFAWDLSLTLGGRYVQNAIAGTSEKNASPVLLVSFSLEYKDFYLEADKSNLPGGAIGGYHLIDGENWGLDAIFGSYLYGFDSSGVYDTTNPPELAGIEARDNDFNLGLHYFAEFKYLDFSSSLVHDISGAHNSWLARHVISKEIPAGNWEIRASAGIDLYSAKLSDYYLGVSPNEVTSFRPEYYPGITLSYFFTFVADYPINESWVLSSGFLYGLYSNSANDSPLTDKNSRAMGYVGITYVF